MIAALFVDPKGCYAGLDGVELWDEARDARLYPGPHPVVAHPPCARWCQLAGLVEARYGYKVGDDGGCFKAALTAVRQWGGVLEHPAYTKAWVAFGLPDPIRGAWLRTMCGGWVCEVDQAAYGHRLRKSTWLYAHGVDDPPRLNWARHKSKVWMTWLRRDGQGRPMKPPSDERMGKKERNATPTEFRDILIAMARSVKRETS